VLQFPSLSSNAYTYGEEHMSVGGDTITVRQGMTVLDTGASAEQVIIGHRSARPN